MQIQVMSFVERIAQSCLLHRNLNNDPVFNSEDKRFETLAYFSVY